MTDAAYVPIMLQRGWVLERYYGWSVVQEGATLKLLRKTRGPITTLLLLARDASDDDVADIAARHGVGGCFSLVVFNDFSSRAEEEGRTIAGIRFKRVATGRWFGVGTFVFDLSEPLETLWSKMAPRERTKCRKVERLGITVDFDEQPTDEAIGAFLELYGRMARARGLERPCRDTLQRMFADGSLLMARCRDPAGRCLMINVTYRCDDQGYFLHGVRAEEIPDGVGHYAHWETIRKLKGMGVRWYDMGLVPSRDNSDGIYRFKASLGGTFVDFGREFQFVPAGLRAAYRAFRDVRTGLRKVL
jgi:hypothetical protein